MSFGYSASDVILFGQLAWKTLQNSRKACGEHDELTREVSSLHLVIRRLEKEVSKPESPINRPGDRCKEELQAIVDGCEKVLKLLNRVLKKYNTLSEKERSVKKLWQRVRFGNGELADIRDLREKMTYYTSALSLFVNMVSMGSMGRVEQKMETAGEDIRELRIAVNGITAHLLSANKREGSVLTTYADDDKAVWKEFRRELIEEGFSSATIRKHKRLIKAYIKELGDRGLLDDEDPHDSLNLSRRASTPTDDLASASRELKGIPKAASIKVSKVESRSPRNDQFKAIENGVERPSNDVDPLLSDTESPLNDTESPLNDTESPLNDTESPPNDVKPPPDDASITCYYFGGRSELGSPHAFFKEAPTDPPGFREIVFSHYACCNMASDNSDRGQWRSESSVLLLPEHFRARFRVLIECLPHIWIFRAREDMDIVYIRVERTTLIEEDWKVVSNLFWDALRLLGSFEGFTSGYIVWGNPYLESSCESERLFFTKLEEFMNSEWRFTAQGVGKGVNPMKEWIRQFDAQVGANAVRITDAWAQAAELVKNRNFNGTRSLALYFTEEISGSESRAESHEQIDNLRSATPSSRASSTSSPCPPVFEDGGACGEAYGDMGHAKTQVLVEYLDANLSPPGSDQDEPYHPSHCDAARISPGKARDTNFASDNPLVTIWQDNYIGTLLPQCENFISDPPCDPKARDSEYKRLSEHIISQVVLRLDAVDSQGDYALGQQKKKFINQAEEMLAGLDDVYNFLNFP